MFVGVFARLQDQHATHKKGRSMSRKTNSGKKMLKKESKNLLLPFRVKAANKEHEFWQRDSLAIPIYNRKTALQKLKYIHNNPLAEHWQLSKHPCDYEYSSARYYELSDKRFNFLKDLWEVF